MITVGIGRNKLRRYRMYLREACIEAEHTTVSVGIQIVFSIHSQGIHHTEIGNQH